MNEITKNENILQALQNLSKEEMRAFLKNEIAKRIENPPIFDRRLHKENYKFKKRILERDGLKCQQCKKILISKEVIICHKIQVSFFPEWAFELWNGYVGCKECNRKDGYTGPKAIKKDIEKAKELQ